MTIDRQGRRITGGSGTPQKPRILGLGCSSTFGLHLQDEATFLYQLQQRFPDLEILNFGVSGYGTYQCLLRLREYFRTERAPVKAVLYFFLAAHPERNVATLKWLEHSRASREYFNPIPYCDLDREGNLREFPPAILPVWPFEEKSVLLHLLKKSWYELKFQARSARKDAVTKALILEMDKECKKKGVPFFLAFFDCRLKGQQKELEKYEEFSKVNNIRYVDCTDPRSLRPEMRVPGDIWQHPGTQLNQIWAKCLETQIQKEKLVPE